MKEQDLRNMANKVAAEFPTESAVKVFTKARSKAFRESTLEGEMNNHLG